VCCPLVSYVAYASITDDNRCQWPLPVCPSRPTLCVGGPVIKKTFCMSSFESHFNVKVSGMSSCSQYNFCDLCIKIRTVSATFFRSVTVQRLWNRKQELTVLSCMHWFSKVFESIHVSLQVVHGGCCTDYTRTDTPLSKSQNDFCSLKHAIWRLTMF